MNYSVTDAAGLIISGLSYIPLLLAPGLALGSASDLLDFRRRNGVDQGMIGLALGLALMPLIDSMAVRFAGLDTALALTLLLGGAGCVAAVRGGRLGPVSRGADALALAVAAGWLLLVLAEWIDYDGGVGLRQPLIVVDMVKHTATVQAIHDGGTPPTDPFFLRPARASYYYFFYTPAALAQRLCAGLADARATVGALAFWTGLGLFGLARLVLEAAGLSRAASRRAPLILLVLLPISSLDIVSILKKGLTEGIWLINPGEGWIGLLLWVPHHVVALIASLVGFATLAQGFDASAAGRSARRKATSVLLAGAAFASALGLSLWVTLATAVAAGLWLAVLAAERRWRPAAMLAGAGLVGLAFAAPQIADLAVARSGAPLPIRLAVREFRPWDAAVQAEPVRSIGRLLLLPLNYFAEFGVFFSGAILFWTLRRRREVHANELARVLTLSAVAGLLLGSFLESTLYNNDLGWRVILFPEFAALLWTTAALDERLAGNAAPLTLRRVLGLTPPLILGLGAIGYATLAYGLVAMRAYAAMSGPPEMRFIGAHPRTDRALRDAYAWANAHLDRSAVMQHDPAPVRVFDFGLYSRNRVAVSDSYAGLYGAPDVAVTKRFNEVLPIFALGSAASVVRARAIANGIDDLIVSADDPVWKDPASWVWTTPALYASPRVRIVAVQALGGQR